MIHGVWQDSSLYGLLAEEWPARSEGAADASGWRTLR